MTNFIESSASLIVEPDVKKKIELIGRTCYRSEDKISKGSADKFVANVMEKKHYSILEHVPVYIVFHDKHHYASISRGGFINGYRGIRAKLNKVPFQSGVGTFKYIPDLGYGVYAMCVNARTIAEMFDDIYEYMNKQGCVSLEEIAEFTTYGFDYFYMLINSILNHPQFNFLVNPNISEFSNIPESCKLKLDDFQIMTEYEINFNDPILKEVYYFGDMAFYTIKFICDRGTSHEIVRHRNCAFMQESTRYCNYSDGVNFIMPKIEDFSTEVYIKSRLFDMADIYETVVDLGVKPELARCVLPNALATTLIVTASLNEWRHIFDLRLFDLGGVAHPQIKEVMQKAYDLIKDEF